MTNRFYKFALTILLLTTHAMAQSGGQFTIEKSVIATGGSQQSTGGQFAVSGTTGQQTAGDRISNSPFMQTVGFWTPDQFIPTAAEVTVSGRVLTADGRGIRNVVVTITDANGETRRTISSSFGYFRFADVPSGETYIFNVSAKRYRFVDATQIHTILEETSDLVFIAIGEAERPN